MLLKLLGRLYQRTVTRVLGLDAWAVERLPDIIRRESQAGGADTLAALLGGSGGRPDLERLTHLLASIDSARYITEHMGLARRFVERPELICHALGACTVQGLILEFGVFYGETLRVIADETPQPVYGFDSFEGLPEDWTSSQRKGRFSLEGNVPVFDQPNVSLVRGWFDKTLPGFLQEHQEPIRFLHVDSDLYSSAVTVLNELADRLVPGSVILFDEYFNYPGWQQHEFRAFQEFVSHTGRRYEYLGYTSAHQAVAVRLL